MPTYPEPPPIPRIAWNKDGTQMFYNATAATPTQLAQGTMDAAASMYGGGIYNHGRYVGAYMGWYFPAPVDIKYWFARTGGSSPSGSSSGVLEVSTDSTNFNDGTWVGMAGSTSRGSGPPASLQSINNVIAGNHNGIKACRLYYYGGTSSAANNVFQNMHIYGNYSAPSLGGLRIWHPTEDREMTGVDFYYGDVLRSSSSDILFRVKNTSAKTANGVTIGHAVEYDGSPTFSTQFLFSTNGTTFNATAGIGNLAPGAVSNIMTVRRTFVSNAALGLYETRIYANASVWV
jgi:hypothetical protein